MANEERDPAEMVEEHETQTNRGGATTPHDDEAADLASLRAERDRLRAAVGKANKESADRRRRLDELERAEEERTRASLSDAERAKRERADLERRAAEAERKASEAEAAHRRTIVDAAVEREAVKMGFIYPDIAPSLIDPRRVSIDEETGKPAGIKEALERLVKDRPALVEASPRGGSPPREGPRRLGGGGGSRQPDFDASVRDSGNYV